MTAYRLDVRELHRRIEAKRVQAGLSGRELARHLGFSVHTLTRIKDGRCPDADALVTLLAWLATEIAYVTRPNRGGLPPMPEQPTPILACRGCQRMTFPTGAPEDSLVAEHCGECPPWVCDSCGQLTSMAKPCPCWIRIEDLPLAEVKALFAADGTFNITPGDTP